MAKIEEIENLRKHEYGYLETVDKPSVDELQKFYAEKYFQLNKGNYRAQYGSEEIDYFNEKIRQKAHIVDKLRNNKSGSLLDIGCGEGFTLAYFLDKGWDVKGLDFSIDGVSRMNPRCQKYVEQGDLISSMDKHIDKSQCYDLVWLTNVLEHVLDPPLLMNKIRNLLRLNGILVITVPNDFSSFQKLMLNSGQIDKPFWVNIPEHLSYFSTDSLREIGKATGFECNSIIADFPIDWFLSHPDSNYVIDRSKGKSAHAARIQIENLIAQKPPELVNGFYEAMAKIGLGRQISAFFTIAG